MGMKAVQVQVIEKDGENNLLVVSKEMGIIYEALQLQGFSPEVAWEKFSAGQDTIMLEIAQKLKIQMKIMDDGTYVYDFIGGMLDAA